MSRQGRDYLVFVYIYSFVVIPDLPTGQAGLIRYPEAIEKTGFRLEDCRNDRQTNQVHTQTLFNIRKQHVAHQIDRRHYPGPELEGEYSLP